MDPGAQEHRREPQGVWAGGLHGGVCGGCLEGRSVLEWVRVYLPLVLVRDLREILRSISIGLRTALDQRN